MFLLLLILTSLLGQSVGLVCSKTPPLHPKVVQTRDRTSNLPTVQTLITISLGLKETACFSLDSPNFRQERFAISMDDVKSVHQYKNWYSFGLPDVDVKCVCDCPGAEDFCNSHTDSCRENDVFAAKGSCFNIYEQGKSNEGCTAFLSGSAEVCCSLHVTPYNRTLWRALELDQGYNQAVFTVTNLKTNKAFTTEVDIAGGNPILQPFYMTVSAPSIQSPLKPGWYFGTDTGNQVFGGVELNGLSEYDTTKLGWYKYTRGDFELDKSQVMDSFNVEVNNCDSDDLKVEFDNKNTLKTLGQATELHHLFKTSVSKVDRLDDERRLEAYFRQYSNIELTISLNGDYTVVQISDESTFEDFEGVVMMDKHSNYFVNITIMEGKGSIHGNLTVDGETDVFKINIHHQIPVSVFYIRLSSLCEAHEKANLCLFTAMGDGPTMCKEVACSMEPLQEFELPDSAIDYQKGDKMSILSPATWAKHLNPAEWFNGIKNWKEAVIMATELVGIITIIGIVLKVMKMFGCLGKCWACICGPINFDFLKRRKKKVKPKLSSDQDRERKVLLDDLMDHLSTADGSITLQNMNYRNRSRSSESSPSYLLKTPRYIELDDVHGNPITLMTGGDSQFFVYDKNMTLSSTANSTPSSSRTSTSTPQSLRKAATLPGGITLGPVPIPGAAPPLPPRTGTPTPSGHHSNKKSSTLPPSLSATPPPSRIPIALNRFGRRHSAQSGVLPAPPSPSQKRASKPGTAPSSPNLPRVAPRIPAHGSPSLGLARVHLQRQLFGDHELELMTNSTESLLSRGGDSFRRPGHSRNGSRVLLLKNSSEL